MIRFISSLSLLLLAYYKAGALLDSSLSLWIATGVLFITTVFLERSWQLLAIPLSMPLLFSLYSSGLRDPLVFVVLSLLVVLSSNSVSILVWVVSVALFIIEGLFLGFQLNTLPYLIVGLLICSVRDNKSKQRTDLTKLDLFTDGDRNLTDEEERFQLKKEINRLRSLLEERNRSIKELDTERFERVGIEVGEVVSKLSLLLFEIRVVLDEKNLSELTALNDLEDELKKLQKLVPNYWPKPFFTESLSDILNKTALNKKAILSLRLEKIGLKVGEKFVLNEITDYFLQENKEYDITLENGEDGLFYVIRPITEKVLDRRLERLIAGIGGTIIFTEDELYLIWRKEENANLTYSTS